MPQAPLPAALRNRRGNGSQQLGLTVVAPVVGDVEPPERLSPVAADLWRDMAGQLAECGLLSTLDLVALEMLCEAYSDWCQASEELAQNTIPVDPRDPTRGFRQSRYQLIKDGNGWTKIVPHPAYAAMQDADRRIRQWLVEFGCTPAARAKWKVAEERTQTWEDEQEIDLDSLSQHERDAIRDIIARRRATAGE